MLRVPKDSTCVKRGAVARRTARPLCRDSGERFRCLREGRSSRARYGCHAGDYDGASPAQDGAATLPVAENGCNWSPRRWRRTNFNNILTVIQSYASTLEESIDVNDARHGHTTEISNEVRRQRWRCLRRLFERTPRSAERLQCCWRCRCRCHGWPSRRLLRQPFGDASDIVVGCRFRRCCPRSSAPTNRYHCASS